LGDFALKLKPLIINHFWHNLTAIFSFPIAREIQPPNLLSARHAQQTAG
jgi:hypothetical protein